MDICTDFLVVPPAGALFADPELHKAVLASLNARFPQYQWEIASGHTSQSGNFVVIPAASALPEPGETLAISIEALEEFSDFLDFQFIEPTKRIN